MILGPLALHTAVRMSSMALTFAGGNVLVLRMTLSVILATCGLWSLIPTQPMSPAASELFLSEFTALMFSLILVFSISVIQSVLSSSRQLSPS